MDEELLIRCKELLVETANIMQECRYAWGTDITDDYAIPLFNKIRDMILELEGFLEFPPMMVTDPKARPEIIKEKGKGEKND